jgi:hypothetical protein
MPEEYRIWKEKVDALTAKQQQERSSGSGGNCNGNITGSNQLYKSNSTQSLSLKSQSVDDISVVNAQELLPKITYANPAEALEAFKELLSGKNISAIAKYKDVQDLCSSDPRWNALSSAGEKKQALSEYQVRNL